MIICSYFILHNTKLEKSIRNNSIEEVLKIPSFHLELKRNWTSIFVWRTSIKCTNSGGSFMLKKNIIFATLLLTVLNMGIINPFSLVTTIDVRIRRL